MTTHSREAALFVGPPIVVAGGRRFVGASVGTAPSRAAQGAQFCLWPDALNPRNTVMPTKKYHEHQDDLLLREIKADGSLGEIFWQTESPEEWRDASRQLDFKSLSEMDAATQSAFKPLTAAAPESAFCSRNGTLKCEACSGGCQRWTEIPTETRPFLGNERTHYRMPRGDETDDVILYRSGGGISELYASMRSAAGQGSWSEPVRTSLPNDESNLNAGSLPDGRVYLVNNPVFIPKNDTVAGGSSGPPTLGTLRFRDPIGLSTSKDGLRFDTMVAVMSCTDLASWSTCRPRYQGDGKNSGPSYPQGLTVVDPAPVEHQGFYVVATNNKEDVWLAKVPFSSI